METNQVAIATTNERSRLILMSQSGHVAFSCFAVSLTLFDWRCCGDGDAKVVFLPEGNFWFRDGFEI